MIFEDIEAASWIGLWRRAWVATTLCIAGSYAGLVILAERRVLCIYVLAKFRALFPWKK